MTSPEQPGFLEGLIEIQKSKQILITKLAKKTTADEINEYFSKFGLLADVKVLKDKNGQLASVITFKHSTDACKLFSDTTSVEHKIRNKVIELLPVPKTLTIEPTPALKPKKKKTRSKSVQRTAPTTLTPPSEELTVKAKCYDLELENAKLKKQLNETINLHKSQKTALESEIAMLKAKLSLAEQNVETLMKCQISKTSK